MESVVILCLGDNDMEENLYKFSTDKEPMDMEGHMSPSSLCVIYNHWNFYFLKSSFVFWVATGFSKDTNLQFP